MKNVKVVDTLPEGLSTKNGNQKVVKTYDVLAPGASKTFTYTVIANKVGTFQHEVVATGSSLESKQTVTTVVKAPVLEISQTATEKVFIGRKITTKTVVKNSGNGEAPNLVLTQRLPGGVKLIGASTGYKIEGNIVTWNVQTLAAGSQVTATTTYVGRKAGNLKTSVQANAKCAKAIADSADTVVVGIPAILLEVIDVQDPVEVGGDVTYLISATNQGSAPGTNIVIDCQLEDSEDFVSGSGATAVEVGNNSEVSFKALGTLAPKEKAVWKVIVKATKTSDTRFTVKMTSDQLTRPVSETEATNLY